MSISIHPDTIIEDDSLVVNVSNANFFAIFEGELGYKGLEYCGSLDVADVKARIDEYQPDQKAADAHNAELRARGCMFTGGPGYFDSRLIEIRALCEWCIANEVENLIYA